MGEKVRYDGGHALDRFLKETLGAYVRYVPVCPEVECGFGTPREAMRLTGDPEHPRLVTTRTGVDHTERMEAWARARVAKLENDDLCGFIFKSNSPSSGMERVKVYDDRGVPRKIGVGIFARIFMEHFPLLPVEEDGRLHDPALRENFIDRIFTYKRYRESMDRTNRRGALADFHTRHKLLLMAHSPKHLKEIGHLVAHAKELSTQELVGRYEQLLLAAMALKSSPAKHVNVLHHMMGYFSLLYCSSGLKGRQDAYILPTQNCYSRRAEIMEGYGHEASRYRESEGCKGRRIDRSSRYRDGDESGILYNPRREERENL